MPFSELVLKVSVMFIFFVEPETRSVFHAVSSFGSTQECKTKIGVEVQTFMWKQQYELGNVNQGVTG